MKQSNTLHSICGRLSVAVGLVLMTIASARADYKNTVLADSPIAYYALDLTIDTNGTATDSSGNGNDSTYYNIYPSAGPSVYLPNAANFSGADLQSHVDLGSGTNSGILNFGGPITMEAWVQSTNTTQGPADILGKGYDSAQSYDELCLRANGGVNYYGGTYNNVNGGASASGGQQTTNWTYLVSTYDGTNWNLYVNTKLAGHGADSVGAINFPDAWGIGTGSADGAGRFFAGNICQVALYTNALTASQVLNHYYFALVNAAPSVSAPIIVNPPQSQPSYVGGSVIFSFSAVSSLAMTNQWYSGNTPLAGQTNSTLTLTNLQLTSAGNYKVVVGNANGTNSAVATLTVSTPRSLEWSAGGNSGTWDNSSTNWINLSNSQQTVFNSGDQVLFDDTPGVPTTVTVSGSVFPSVLNVNASANNFSFSGSGLISGYGSLVKSGSSTLSITTPSGFAGTVALNGGMVYAGNNCFASVASIAITNDATLDFAGGQFNNFKPVSISGSGVNGQGALINSYADYPNESMKITLTGDATFGGSARWDLASGSQISGAHNLTVDFSADTGGPYGEWNSPVIGSNVLSITLINGSKIGAKNCDSSFQNPGTVLTIDPNGQLVFWNGGWNGSLHVNSGATVYLWTAPSAFNGNTITLEDNAQWLSWNNGSDEPINSAMILNGVVHMVVGDHNMIYTNLISGPGGFVIDAYNHAMVFSASNTYSGPTIIADGLKVALTGNGSISHSSLIFFGGGNPASAHIDASGRSDQTLTLASGQTLEGIGGVNGSLVVSSGATISPAGTNTTISITTGANPVGTLAAANNVTLNGTTVIKLNGSGTNDMIQAGAGITYGGTLNLANISDAPLAAGNSFQVFSAATYAGSFANITPATPGAGLAWDLTQLGSGKVNVVSASGGPVINHFVVSGGNVIFNGTGGTANDAYYVLTSTNIATPLTNWIILSTNAFDNSGNFNVTNPVSPNTPKQFYILKH
jgi:autotransporter-associated beta strand protein